MGWNCKPSTAIIYSNIRSLRSREIGDGRGKWGCKKKVSRGAFTSPGFEPAFPRLDSDSVTAFVSSLSLGPVRALLPPSRLRPTMDMLGLALPPSSSSQAYGAGAA